MTVSANPATALFESAGEQQATRRVAVIGAGLSGLAAAHRLISQSSSVQVDVFDGAGTPGGIVRTEHVEDCLLEHGPDSFITNKPGGLALCEELGITSELIPTDARYRRALVLYRGQPHPVPAGFQLMQAQDLRSVWDSPVLSLAGRLRLLAEWMIPPRRSSDDESLQEFATRRCGREAFERLIQPLVSGIYTADPQRLSAHATMQRFVEMEQQHGGLIRAALASRRAGRAGDADSSGARFGMFTTPARGMSRITEAAVDWLQKSGRCRIHLRTAVWSADRHGSGWRLAFNGRSPADFDAVIFAVAARRAADMLPAPDFATLRSVLRQIEFASSAIVISVHRLNDASHPLDASGLVVPVIEKRSIVAVSFSSRKFAGRAPDDRIVLRTFVGGALQPELLNHDDDGLVTLVREELQSLFGLRSAPLLTRVARYSNAMPQYHVGHLERVTQIEQLVATFPGLELAGNSLHGVGIPDAIASGRAAADRLLQQMTND